MTSSVKKTRKSYAEPEEDEFDDAEEEEEEEEEEQEEGDAAADTKQVNGGDEEEEDDEDMDEDEYVVEKIFAHYIAKDVRLSLACLALSLNYAMVLGVWGERQG